MGQRGYDGGGGVTMGAEGVEMGLLWRRSG